MYLRIIKVPRCILIDLGLAFTDWTDKDLTSSNVYRHQRIGLSEKNDDEHSGWLSAKIDMPVSVLAGP